MQSASPRSTDRDGPSRSRVLSALKVESERPHAASSTLAPSRTRLPAPTTASITGSPVSGRSLTLVRAGAAGVRVFASSVMPPWCHTLRFTGSEGHSVCANLLVMTFPEVQVPARFQLSPKVAVSIVFVVGMFMNILDITIVNVALPSIAADFNESPAAVASVSVGYLVSLAVFIPASGWLGDRFGNKNVLLVALGIFT